jgi:hypothetical protein
LPFAGREGGRSGGAGDRADELGGYHPGGVIMQVGDQAAQLGGIASGDADVILDDPDGDRDPAAVTDGSFTNGNTYKWYVEACDQRVCSVPTATQSDQ